MSSNNPAKWIKWASETPQIRKNILQMIYLAQSGHPGGSLSCVEIIYTLMAKDGVMKYDPSHPLEKERDRFILSKGHACPALYAILSATGHDITQSELMTLRQLGSRLQGHPDRVRIPYLEASTGSLGQGASIAQGIAMSYKLDNIKNRVFALLGDGEMQEGQIWEVALSAPHHKLDNLTLILDYNKGQIDGPTKKVLDLDPLVDKWQAFGWDVEEIDGHNYSELFTALAKKSIKPQMIIAHTIKGKGVSFMEGNIEWHGKAPNSKEMELAMNEISSNHKIGL